MAEEQASRTARQLSEALAVSRQEAAEARDQAAEAANRAEEAAEAAQRAVQALEARAHPGGERNAPATGFRYGVLRCSGRMKERIAVSRCCVARERRRTRGGGRPGWRRRWSTASSATTRR